jgi:hypothetical protein
MRTFKEFCEALNQDYWQNASGPGIKKITPYDQHDPAIYDKTRPMSYTPPRPTKAGPLPAENPDHMFRMAGESDDDLLARVGPKVFTQITGKTPPGMPQSTQAQPLPANTRMSDIEALGQGPVTQRRPGWFGRMFGKR